MQFQKNSSIGKSNVALKLLIKIAVFFLILFLLLFLLNKIEFPSPSKKIEKIISNETFKVVK